MSKSTIMKKRVIKQSGEPWNPHGYQKRGVKFLLEHQAAGLLLDPGLGKTSIVLAAFSFLKKRKLASKMLVIAPLRP
jgi:superfamily II DNA or RNA helicase